MYIKHRTASGNSFHPKIQEMYYLSGENINVFIAGACKRKRTQEVHVIKLVLLYYILILGNENEEK
jgi:hypothetical protein